MKMVCVALAVLPHASVAVKTRDNLIRFRTGSAFDGQADRHRHFGARIDGRALSKGKSPSSHVMVKSSGTNVKTGSSTSTKTRSCSNVLVFPQPSTAV